MNENQKIVIYQNDEGTIDVDVKLLNNDLWLSLNQIAELFGRDKSVISRHLSNVFKEEELDRDSVVAFFATTAQDGKTYQVDHSTIYRWVQYYAPKILAKLKWYWKPKLGESWRVDETYIRVKGKWTYLYRALDKSGNTIDFYLSSTRNTKAAKRFLRKALNSIPKDSHPKSINTDKNPTYGKALRELKSEGQCSPDLEHRQVKYLNNIIESDHGKLKRLINPTLGFKSMKTAYATIKGFEVMLMFKKGRFDFWKYGQGVQGEINLITNNLLTF